MKHAYGLNIPQSLEDVCTPEQMALLVYDMQAGIVRQCLDAGRVTANVASVVTAARHGGFRVFFSRHLSLPNRSAGVSQLRTAMAWQRKDKAEDTKPAFPRDSLQAQIIPEVTPLESEVIFDKLGMSFFVGTPLEMALRDCGISAIAVMGVVLEVGIEPTIRHAADLGFLPALVVDACGSVNEEARKRSLESLSFAGATLVTESATICGLLARGER
ncbi:MAG TPA: cysteine hydrolase [Terracidiphilus sp.]|jgi:nicotinamidase-related amidase